MTDDDLYLEQDSNSHNFIIRATSHGGQLGRIEETRDGTVRFVRQDGQADSRVFQSVDEALAVLRTDLKPGDAR